MSAAPAPTGSSPRYATVTCRATGATDTSRPSNIVQRKQLALQPHTHPTDLPRRRTRRLPRSRTQNVADPRVMASIGTGRRMDGVASSVFLFFHADRRATSVRARLADEDSVHEQQLDLRTRSSASTWSPTYPANRYRAPSRRKRLRVLFSTSEETSSTERQAAAVVNRGRYEDIPVRRREPWPLHWLPRPCPTRTETSRIQSIRIQRTCTSLRSSRTTACSGGSVTRYACRSGSCHDPPARDHVLAAALVMAVAASGATPCHAAFEQVYSADRRRRRAARAVHGRVRGRHPRDPAHRGTAFPWTPTGHGPLRARRRDFDAPFDRPLSPNSGAIADLAGMSRDGRRIFFVIPKPLWQRHRRLRALLRLHRRVCELQRHRHPDLGQQVAAGASFAARRSTCACVLGKAGDPTPRHRFDGRHLRTRWNNDDARHNRADGGKRLLRTKLPRGSATARGSSSPPPSS